MKKFLLLKSITAMVLALTVFMCSTVFAESGVKKPTSAKDLQRRLFLNSKCSDGLTNGERIYGKNFNPDDMNTWVGDREHMKEMLGLSKEYGGIGSFPEGDAGINNKVIVYDLIDMGDPNGGLLALDGYAYFTFGGNMQFIDLEDSYYIYAGSHLDCGTITLVNMSTVSIGGTAREFNLHNQGIDISLCSNSESGMYVSYSTENGHCTARCDVSYDGSIHDVPPEFEGWYNRETGELYSDGRSIDLKKASSEGVHRIEARYSINGTVKEISQIGDVNDDKVVNTADAVYILRDCVSDEVKLYEDYAKFDMQLDGYINTGDAVAVLKECVGL